MLCIVFLLMRIGNIEQSTVVTFLGWMSLSQPGPGLRGQMLCAMTSTEKQNSVGLPDTSCFFG